MKIALHGFGKMGQAVERVAGQRDHQIVARFTTDRPPEATTLNSAEVIVDFSSSRALPRIVEVACLTGVNLVIGTTGWEDLYQAVKDRCRDSRIGVVYASNFSPGANVLFALSRKAAGMFRAFDYQAGIEERHHAEKKDAPSGTAIRLARELREGSEGEFDPPIASSRVGKEFGLHTVFFDSADDLVELSHRARGREGFARGAVVAAERLRGRTGFYSFEELLEI